MEKNKIIIYGFLLLLLCFHESKLVKSYEYEGGEEEEWGGQGGGEEEWGGQGGGGQGGGGERSSRFLMKQWKQVIRSEGGEMRVYTSPRGRIVDKPMHIGFLTMEPKTLFLPQYLDSSLLIFLRQGEAKLGVICNDEFGEKRLKAGDIYWIPAGSVFYLFNTGEGQRLHVITSIDPSQSLGFETFQPFYIGGGRSSVLSGFDTDTLASAFNVSRYEIQEMRSSKVGGPIVHVMDRPEQPEQPETMWSKFLELKQEEKHKHMKKLLMERNSLPKDEEIESWMSWRYILKSILAKNRDKASHCEDSYNIYDRKPDFKNEYGWSVALDYSDYKPLKYSGIGVYHVNLTAGSMMAPHLNPRATEYGVVLAGTGEIEVVYPNGTSARKITVSVGDVFWIPRYFAFCQIASRIGPFEFFGFTTSAHENRPQFLVGSNSLLTSLNLSTLSTAFGVDEETMTRLRDAQRKAVILPTAAAAPPRTGEEIKY